MKQQISNRHIPGRREQLLFTIIAAIAITALFIIERNNPGFSIIKFLMAALLMVLFFSVWYYFSYARFYKVEADQEFIYFSRFLHPEKIEISRIISVTPEHIPLSFLYRNVYRVSVVYLDKKRKEKKIRFLSVESKQQDAREMLKSLAALKHLLRIKTGNGNAARKTPRR